MLFWKYVIPNWQFQQKLLFLFVIFWTHLWPKICWQLLLSGREIFGRWWITWEYLNDFLPENYISMNSWIVHTVTPFPNQYNWPVLCVFMCVRVVQFFFFDLNGDGMTTFNDMVDLQVWWKKYKLKTTNLILKWIEFLLEENYSFHMLVSCFWWWSQKTQFANKWE